MTFAPLVLLLLLALGLLVSLLATIPSLASKNKNRLSTDSFRFTVVFLAFAFLRAFPFLAFLYPVPSCPSLA